MFRILAALILAAFAFAAQAAVDANKASQAELETVKGIGPALSSKILDARKAASFKDWNDLVERVGGVGPGNAAKFSQARTDGQRRGLQRGPGPGRRQAARARPPRKPTPRPQAPLKVHPTPAAGRPSNRRGSGSAGPPAVPPSRGRRAVGVVPFKPASRRSPAPRCFGPPRRPRPAPSARGCSRLRTTGSWPAPRPAPRRPLPLTPTPRSSARTVAGSSSTWRAAMSSSRCDGAITSASIGRSGVASRASSLSSASVRLMRCSRSMSAVSASRKMPDSEWPAICARLG
jgi:competence protein ComEA